MFMRMLRLAPGFSGFVFALLLMLCFSAPQSAAGMQVPAAHPDGSLLASMDPVTTYTYLPVVVRNCRASLSDDFSNSASGWPRGAEPYANYAYDKGVYKITFNPDFSDFNEGVGASPDWMVPNDAAIRVDAWTSDVWGGPGLVFGLGYWEGTYDWKEWYVFSVDSDQNYYLEKWYDDSSDELVSGYSSAIKTDGRVRQSLEVRRAGTAMTLVVNGVVLETVDDSTDPYTGTRSVGVFSYSDATAIYDNFQVNASGCITTPLDAQSANGRLMGSMAAKNEGSRGWRIGPRIYNWTR